MLQMNPAVSRPRITLPCAAGRGFLCKLPVLVSTCCKAHKYPASGSELPGFFCNARRVHLEKIQKPLASLAVKS